VIFTFEHPPLSVPAVLLRKSESAGTAGQRIWLDNKTTETNSVNFKVMYLLMLINSLRNYTVLSQNILTQVLHKNQPNQSNSH
jgi:hypothetical protein